MPITFYCPSCKKRLRAPDNADGKKKSCPNCGTIIQITRTPNDSSVSTEPSVDGESPKVVESVKPTGQLNLAPVMPEAQTSCPFCHAKMLTTATFCSSCGKKLPSPAQAALIQKTTEITEKGCRIGCLSIFGLFGVLFIYLLVVTDHVPNASTYSKVENSARNASSLPARNWYEGGTLHNKSAIDWQGASPADKLATCGDFVTKMWKNGDLKSEVSDHLSTVDDVRPYAQQLVIFLDAALRVDPDPEQNRKMLTNRTVSETAVVGMITLGWTKNGK